jgi:hypothetical protein
MEFGKPVSSGTTEVRDKIQSSPRVRDKGQSLDGENINFKELDKRVNKWRKSLGLYSPDDIPPGHDESHTLLRDYMGKSSEQIAKLLGGSGKGPSVLEEIFVDVVERMARFKAKEKRSEFLSSDKLREEIMRSIGISDRLGFVPSSSPLKRSQDRAVNSIIRVMRTMAKNEDFDKFIDTIRVVRKRGYDMI